MESASVLESIAEVAIALAGFGGIAAGLGHRARGTWSSDDRLRLMFLAGASLVVVFACFLPYVVFHLGFTAPWRMASALFLLYPSVFLVYMLWYRRRWSSPRFSQIATWLVLSSQILALSLLFAVALGYAEVRQFGFYLAAVLLVLFQSSLYFVRLLATSFRSTERAA